MSLLLFVRKLIVEEGICLRLHSYQVAGWRSELRPADSCLHSGVESQLSAKAELNVGIETKQRD